MNKLILDKEFFNLDSEKSAGLISGLKTLARRGFTFEAEGLNLSENDLLFSILKSEGIILNGTTSEPQKIFTVTLNKTTDKKAICISAKTGINNFEDAVNLILTKLRTASVKRKTKETEISIDV